MLQCPPAVAGIQIKGEGCRSININIVPHYSPITAAMGNTVTRIPGGAGRVWHQQVGRGGAESPGIYNALVALLNSQCYVMFENVGCEIVSHNTFTSHNSYLVVRTPQPQHSTCVHPFMRRSRQQVCRGGQISYYHFP